MSVDRKTYGPEYDRYMMAETYLCRHCLHRHSILTGGNCAGEWLDVYEVRRTGQLPEPKREPFAPEDVYAVALSHNAIARLRELRLWHYKQSVGAQISADNFHDLLKYAEYAERYVALHIGFVQTLNDFFPADDTAELDAAKVVK